jgi:late competence protein required for DNA uptake (superfamily II DNA/RNA helicase)
MKPDITNMTINMTASELLKFIGNLRCVQCDHYVNYEYSAYDGKMYCQHCWDANREEEEKQRLKEIAKLKARLSELEALE